MLDQWRQEKRGDFGWSVESKSDIKAFWLKNAVFANPDDKVSGKISDSTARILEEKIAEYSAEVTAHSNFSSPNYAGKLTAFAISDDLGGGYLIVDASVGGGASVGGNATFQTLGREAPSHASSSQTSSPAGPIAKKRPFWKRLFGLGDGTPPEQEPAELVGTSGTFRDDRDGNEYRWVRIGKQIWMAENLRFDMGRGCWKNDSDGNTVCYYPRGSLSEACPSGWRAPELEDFEELLVAVGGIDEASIQLRQGGDSGFDAVPYGRRYDDGSFSNTDSAYFWAAHDRDNLAWFMQVYLDRDDVSIRETWDEGLKSDMGTTIRCIRK